MTFARFNTLGQYCSRIIALNRCRIAVVPAGGRVWSMNGVMRSGPGALCGWRCVIILLSSPLVNGRRLGVGGA